MFFGVVPKLPCATTFLVSCVRPLVSHFTTQMLRLCAWTRIFSCTYSLVFIFYVKTIGILCLDHFRLSQLVEVVYRRRDPQPQVGENYSYFINLKPKICSDLID